MPVMSHFKLALALCWAQFIKAKQLLNALELRKGCYKNKSVPLPLFTWPGLNGSLWYFDCELNNGSVTWVQPSIQNRCACTLQSWSFFIVVDVLQFRPMHKQRTLLVVHDMLLQSYTVQDSWTFLRCALQLQFEKNRINITLHAFSISTSCFCWRTSMISGRPSSKLVDISQEEIENYQKSGQPIQAILHVLACLNCS